MLFFIICIKYLISDHYVSSLKHDTLNSAEANSSCSICNAQFGAEMLVCKIQVAEQPHITVGWDLVGNITALKLQTEA